MTERRLAYHFTHVDNLDRLLADGTLYADTHQSCRPAVEVGSVGIKARRCTQAVTCGPEGFVADYVPFYFGPRSPMMYRINRGAVETRSGFYRGGDRELVYLVTSVETVEQQGLRWVATDRNAAAGEVTMTDDRTTLDGLVHWPLMHQRMWKDTDDEPDRMSRRQAELLVHREVPLDAMLGLAVHGPSMQERVQQILGSSPCPGGWLVVRPDWYYSEPEEVSA